LTNDIRDAFDNLKAELIGLANETQDEVRDKLLDLSAKSELVLIDLAEGRMTLEQAEEAKRNLALTARSAVVNAGYSVQARALDAWLAGLSTAIKLVVALA
jgi:hypothetical protein